MGKSGQSYRQARKEAAEKALAEKRSRAVSVVDEDTIEAARGAGERGENIFPVLPEDLFRGYETNHDPHRRTEHGRKWTPEKRAAAVNEIAIRMASGEAVKDILGPNRDRERLPGTETFYTWIFALGDEYVYRVYELAQKMRVQGFVDELIEISDMARDSEEMAEVKGAELAINTRQWVASKIMPWLYGAKEAGGSGITVNINTNLDSDAAEGDAYVVNVPKVEE